MLLLMSVAANHYWMELELLNLRSISAFWERMSCQFIQSSLYLSLEVVSSYHHK